MNRKEARARTTQAIEKISDSIAKSIQQQAELNAQSKERFLMEQDRYKVRKAVEEVTLQKKKGKFEDGFRFAANAARLQFNQPIRI